MVAGKRQKREISRRKRVQQKVEHRRTFGKNFFRISVSILLVLFLGFGVVYHTVKKVIIEQNIKISQQSFKQVQSQFEYARSTAHTIATQVLLDDVCSEFLNAVSDVGMNSVTRNRVRNQLSMYQNTNPSVESIYAYNKNADMFITSGSRFGSVGQKDFSDREIVEIMKNHENYNIQNLIPRERTSSYQNQVEKKENLYSYLLFTNGEMNGNGVVVNLKLDDMIQEFLEMDVMQESFLVILDENRQCLLHMGNTDSEEVKSFLEIAKTFAGQREQYEEHRIEGTKFFVSSLYSPRSGCSYIKAARYDTMFSTLLSLQKKMLIFLFLVTAAVLLIALWNALAILRLHSILEAKQVSKKRIGSPHIFREQFLTDFIHNRKLFRPSNLQTEMEKIGFSVKEEQRFTLVMLFLENYEKFQETFGKKGTYDIKFGFYNIFEETFQEQFRVLGLINRDATMSFILETDEEGLNRIEELFHQFCRNSEVFVSWDFLLFGTGKIENLERIPEQNSRLYKVLGEGFFYPSNTYILYENIQKNHSQKADFQKLDVGKLAKNLSFGKNIQNNYELLIEEMKQCTVTDYMNALIWFGISLVRGAKRYGLSEEDASEFLTCLSHCGKVTEANELFGALFTVLSREQKKEESKKGVTGRLDEVKQYIEENFRDPNITLDMLGDVFHVSSNYLGRLFKKETGLSVSDYINNERMKWVLEQLENTDRPAKEIAESCGFVSTNYFYTFFKKKIGITPQAYREQMFLKK